MLWGHTGSECVFWRQKKKKANNTHNPTHLFSDMFRFMRCLFCLFPSLIGNAVACFQAKCSSSLFFFCQVISYLCIICIILRTLSVPELSCRIPYTPHQKRTAYEWNVFYIRLKYVFFYKTLPQIIK